MSPIRCVIVANIGVILFFDFMLISGRFLSPWWAVLVWIVIFLLCVAIGVWQFERASHPEKQP